MSLTRRALHSATKSQYQHSRHILFDAQSNANLMKRKTFRAQ
jgi:hypothetical protein